MTPPSKKIDLGGMTDKNSGQYIPREISRKEFTDKASKVAAMLKSNDDDGYILVDEVTYLEFFKNNKQKHKKVIFGLHSFLNLYND